VSLSVCRSRKEDQFDSMNCHLERSEEKISAGWSQAVFGGNIFGLSEAKLEGGVLIQLGRQS